jgi:adenylate kinase
MMSALIACCFGQRRRRQRLENVALHVPLLLKSMSWLTVLCVCLMRVQAWTASPLLRSAPCLSSAAGDVDGPEIISAPTAIKARPRSLTVKQDDFIKGYLTKHHGEILVKLVECTSPLGLEMAKANGWSGGSMSIQDPVVTAISPTSISLQVQVVSRGGKSRTEICNLDFETVAPIPSKQRACILNLPRVVEQEGRSPLDEVIRQLCRVTTMVGCGPQITGKLVQLGVQLYDPKHDDDDDDASKSSNNPGMFPTIAKPVGKLPDNMYLNQVPHNRYVRDFFYQTAATAVHDAVVDWGTERAYTRSSRMRVSVEFPELNPSMDSYRIGTLLELTRAVAMKLVIEQNLRVRVCVQASMGVGIFTGLPKQLGGVAKLLQMMDWQSGEGEINEGMIGNYINFGAVGAEHVVSAGDRPDDVFLLVAPQSMIGTDSSIIPLLQQMCDAIGSERPVILINDDLSDKMSSGGQQNVRGRQDRLNFAQSFDTVYYFRNTYMSGTSYFPILGATTKLHPSQPWISYQRRDYADNKGEVYVPIFASEVPPTSEQLMEAIQNM